MNGPRRISKVSIVPPLTANKNILDTCVAPGFSFYASGDYVLSNFTNREDKWRGFTSEH